MTTPTEGSDPTVPVPPSPEPTPEEAAAQQAAAEKAAAEAALNDQIRALAAEIAKQTLTDFDPATIRKAEVTADASTANPPTVSIQISGDTTVTIDGVRYLDSYSPVVGDTVLVIKQNTDLVVLGQINDTPATPAAQGWQTSGGVQYRRVVDNGEGKVQFKGAFTVSGTSLFTVGSTYIPSATRTMVAGRNGEATSVLVQVATGTGAVTIVGGTQTLGSTDSDGDQGTSFTGSGGTSSNGSQGTSTAGGGSTSTTGGGGTSSNGSQGTSSNGSQGTSFNGSQGTSFFGSGGTSSSGGHTHTYNHQHTYNHDHTYAHDHTYTHDHTYSHSHTGDAHDHTYSHDHTYNHQHTYSHSHTLTLALPTTVYFDSLEYFL